MTVGTSHGICDEIEAALEARFGEVHVAIHVEPEQEATRGAFAPTDAPTAAPPA